MKFQPLRDFLNSYLPMLGIPGSDTSIYQGGREVFRYQSGYDNIEKKTPVNPHGVYNLYSCTKISTVCTLLTLLEKGEVHLYDPVYAYLPAYRDITVRFQKENGDWDIRPAETVMTIRHLMSMTAGMDYNMSSPEIQEAVEKTGGRAPTVEIASALAKRPLLFDPGTDYKYSLAHDVLGAVIEVASGKRFSEYMKEALFDPIGMTDTTFDLSEERVARMITPYQFNKMTKRPEEISKQIRPCGFGTEYESGGGGLSSSVDDYVKLAQTLTHMGLAPNGNRILAPATVNLLRTNVLEGKALESFQRMGTQFLGYGYGLGVRTMIDPGQGASLSPTGEFGWDGAKLCYFISDPENDISVFHAEHMGAFHSLVEPRLRNLIYSCLAR